MNVNINKTPKKEEPEVQKFQHYKSARIAMRLLTKEGKKIIFTGYEFLTQDEDIITYLDYEIKNGLPGITKGKLMSMDEANPMEALKREHFKEFKAAQIKEASDKAAGIIRDMGNTKGKGDASINPASTEVVAN